MIKAAFGFLLSMALAYFMRESKAISLAHAIGTIALGVLWTFSSPKMRTERTLCLCAYICGAEVLWRMTKAPIFWEYGKYAVILVLIVTNIRSLFSKITPWIYFLCLMPSTLLILNNLAVDFEDFRRDLSQNISGPLALMVCYLCFSRMKITGEQFRKAIMAFVLPLSGVAFLCSFKLYEIGESIKFSKASSFAASGGFGPNQVSAVLGLGALFVFLYCLDPGPKKSVRNLLIPLGLWFTAQSALTFSRAGLAYAIASIATGGLFFIQSKKIRNRFLIVGILVYFVGNFFIAPKLQQYTSGSLSARFSEKSTTGRLDLMKEEIELFMTNPLFGVGIGQAKTQRTGFKMTVASHTEFTRLLAEHGIFGGISIFLIFWMGVDSVRKTKTKKGKAYASACASWTIFFMMGNGMRLVAPSFVFGLSAAILLPDMKMLLKKRSDQAFPLVGNPRTSGS